MKFPEIFQHKKTPTEMGAIIIFITIIMGLADIVADPQHIVEKWLNHQLKYNTMSHNQ